MNKEILTKLGFGKELSLVDMGICPFCGKEVQPVDFKDELSIKEYKLSGLCQSCQDKTFNPTNNGHKCDKCEQETNSDAENLNCDNELCINHINE